MLPFATISDGDDETYPLPLLLQDTIYDENSLSVLSTDTRNVANCPHQISPGTCQYCEDVGKATAAAEDEGEDGNGLRDRGGHSVSTRTSVNIGSLMGDSVDYQQVPFSVPDSSDVDTNTGGAGAAANPALPSPTPMDGVVTSGPDPSTQNTPNQVSTQHQPALSPSNHNGDSSQHQYHLYNELDASHYIVSSMPASSTTPVQNQNAWNSNYTSSPYMQALANAEPPLNPPPSQEHLSLAMVESMMSTIPAPPPPVALNPHLFALESRNTSLIQFLWHWVRQGLRHKQIAEHYPPNAQAVWDFARSTPDHVHYSDLSGDVCDIQSINWDRMGTSRQAARAMRRMTYENYLNLRSSDSEDGHKKHGVVLRDASFFRFKRTNFRRDVHVPHFQLRGLLGCPSMYQSFYPSEAGIMRINTCSRKTELVADLRHLPRSSRSITTLDANHGVVMGGTLSGGYILQSLYPRSKEEFSENQIGGPNGICNYLRIESSRSSNPVAAVSGNDHAMRILDIKTETIVSKFEVPFAANCSAASADRRLRVVVGDSKDTIIMDAETGKILQQLDGHEDHVFSCDWADNGWTVATGAQSRDVLIWDARRWCTTSGVSTPVSKIHTDMAGARNLRFSPTGSGKSVLVASEEADYVQIWDTDTFQSKQTFDIFGELGGIAFANDGQDLNVLCTDSHRGGLLQFERCGGDIYQEGTNGWSTRPSESGDSTRDEMLQRRGRRPALARMPTSLQHNPIF